eukprot:m.213237 g.213237  ORF g.213237 m.213237 type:complete len:226 (+) comp24095_c0_seq1:30-707(+)
MRQKLDDKTFPRSRSHPHNSGDAHTRRTRTRMSNTLPETEDKERGKVLQAFASFFEAAGEKPLAAFNMLATLSAVLAVCFSGRAVVQKAYLANVAIDKSIEDNAAAEEPDHDEAKLHNYEATGFAFAIIAAFFNLIIVYLCVKKVLSGEGKTKNILKAVLHAAFICLLLAGALYVKLGDCNESTRCETVDLAAHTTVAGLEAILIFIEALLEMDDDHHVTMVRFQ